MSAPIVFINWKQRQEEDEKKRVDFEKTLMQSEIFKANITQYIKGLEEIRGDHTEDATKIAVIDNNLRGIRLFKCLIDKEYKELPSHFNKMTGEKLNAWELMPILAIYDCDEPDENAEKVYALELLLEKGFRIKSEADFMGLINYCEFDNQPATLRLILKYQPEFVYAKGLFGGNLLTHILTLQSNKFDKITDYASKINEIVDIFVEHKLDFTIKDDGNKSVIDLLDFLGLQCIIKKHDQIMSKNAQ